MTGAPTWPRVTMSDVAREANVSNATVSRILEGKVFVSEQTRAAVEAAIERTGYIRNDAARQLAKTTSDTVGLLLRNPTNPAYGMLHAEVQSQTVQRDRQLLTIASPLGSTEADERAALRRLLESRVGGMLIASAQIPPDELVPFAAKAPTVVLARPEEHPQLHAVSYDEVANGRVVAEAVLLAGHRSVGVVMGESGAEGLRSRAIADALLGGGAKVVQLPAGVGPGRPGHSAEAAVELARSGRVSVIMFPNDLRLLSFLGAAQDAGVRVPDDVSATGMDGILPGLDLLGLATVRIPVETVARRGVEVLLELISDPAPERTHHESHAGTFQPGRTLRPV